MASFNFAAPLQRVLITEGYGMPRSGRLHGGLDMRAKVGTPCFAVMAGKVIYAGKYGDTTGLTVELDHGDGVLTRYLHLQILSVSKGQQVSKGTMLGYTGFATSPHLHYDTWVLGDALAQYIAKFGAPRGVLATQNFGGKSWTKVPSEPLIPGAEYQDDVIKAARDYGVPLYNGAKVGAQGGLVLVGFLAVAGAVGYAYYRTL